MKVIVAKSAGFCFGVRRAVDKVYEQIGKTGKPIYTYGPIIHNEEVVNDLKEKGVEVLHSREELEAVRDCVVVIRSHGVGRDIYELLDRDGIEVVRTGEAAVAPGTPLILRDNLTGPGGPQQAEGTE